MIPFLMSIYLNLHLYKSGETVLYVLTFVVSQVLTQQSNQEHTYKTKSLSSNNKVFPQYYSIAANTDQKNNVKVDNKQNICSGRGYTFIFDTENFQDQGWNARRFGTHRQKKMFKYVGFSNCLVVLIWFARTLLSEVNKE